MEEEEDETQSRASSGDGVQEQVSYNPTYDLCSRFPTSSGNHGKPGNSLKIVPCMESHGI